MDMVISSHRSDTAEEPKTYRRCVTIDHHSLLHEHQQLKVTLIVVIKTRALTRKRAVAGYYMRRRGAHFYNALARYRLCPFKALGNHTVISHTYTLLDL